MHTDCYTMVSGDPNLVTLIQDIMYHRFKPLFASHYIKGQIPIALFSSTHIYQQDKLGTLEIPFSFLRRLPIQVMLDFKVQGKPGEQKAVTLPFPLS